MYKYISEKNSVFIDFRWNNFPFQKKSFLLVFECFQQGFQLSKNRLICEKECWICVALEGLWTVRMPSNSRNANFLSRFFQPTWNEGGRKRERAVKVTSGKQDSMKVRKFSGILEDSWKRFMLGFMLKTNSNNVER